MDPVHEPTRARRAFLKSAALGGSLLPAIAFGGAPRLRDEVGAVDAECIERAQALLAIEFTEAERKQMLQAVAEQPQFFKVLRAAQLDNDEGPADVLDVRPFAAPAATAATATSPTDPGVPLPSSEEDVAFAPVARLAQWLRKGELTSRRLTEIYLDRLERIGPKLECVITLTPERAIEQAKRADAESAAGKRRGPLHGIPYGLKDLFDTDGIATTWGAEPWRDRVPQRDATVVAKLEEAGAVLVAKLTLGALAYGDIWFGGTTKNPFKPEQGSSGSSAGSAAAVAAGLVGFALGTETWGSIASPSARCGATGLRPTFGRVSRFGAMALCWSLDKVGPIARTVEDAALVLGAIGGRDERDPSTVDAAAVGAPLAALPKGAKVGILADAFEAAGDADKALLEALRALDVELVEVELPQWDYAAPLIQMIIGVEAAAAFDAMTLSGADDRLKWQSDQAWPNLFRAARFIPAVEFQQARRLRRRLMTEAAPVFRGVNALVAPSNHDVLHAVTNMTGHPAITIRHSFRADGTPRGFTLWGDLYREDLLLPVAHALERKLGLWERRPDVS